jgi:nucleoside-diphosphate-sugar epimerase
MTTSVLVLGGTGATGKHVIRQLLEEGNQVWAIVRSKEKLIGLLPEELKENERLTIIESTVITMSDEELTHITKGCEAVVSCLGHNMTMKGIFGEPKMLVTDSVQRICNAVKQSHLSRPTKFILMGTNGAANPDGSEEARPLGERILLGLLRLLIPPVVDNEEAAKYLSKSIGKEESALEWVVVRPDDLVDGDVSEYTTLSKPEGSLFGGGQTTRSNVADFMCKLIKNETLWKEWLFKMPVLQNLKNV